MTQFILCPPQLTIVIGNQRNCPSTADGRDGKLCLFHPAKRPLHAIHSADSRRQRSVQRRASHRDGQIGGRRRKRRHPLPQEDDQHLKGQEHHNADGVGACHEKQILFAGQRVENSHAGIHMEAARIGSPSMLRKLGIAADRRDRRHLCRLFCRRQSSQNHNQKTNGRPGQQAAGTELKHRDIRKAVPADGLQQKAGKPCYNLAGEQTDGDPPHALPQPLPDHKVLHLSLVRAQTAEQPVKLDSLQHIRTEAGGNHHGPCRQHQQNQKCRHDIERLHGAVFALPHQAKQGGILRHLPVGKAIGIPDFPESSADIDAGFELYPKCRPVIGIFICNCPESVLIHHHAVYVRLEQAAHILQHPGHMVSLCPAIRHSDHDRIAGRQTQLLQRRLVQQRLVRPGRVCPALHRHFC